MCWWKKVLCCFSNDFPNNFQNEVGWNVRFRSARSPLGFHSESTVKKSCREWFGARDW